MEQIASRLEPQWFLLASVVALAAGPLFHEFTRQAGAAFAAMDGLVLVTVGGLVLFDVLPGSLSDAGLYALLAAVAGFAGPYLLERSSVKLAAAGHLLPLLVTVVGLIVHAAVDGMALAPLEAAAGAGSEGRHHEGGLPLAVILHRLPVAFVLWGLLKPARGWRWAAGGLTLMALSTTGGFALGSAYLRGVQSAAYGLFEALVAGSLLHVLLHRPGDRPGGSAALGARLGGIAGAAAGIVLLALVPHGHGPGAGGPAHGAYAEAFVEIALESAPALLAGYVMAGMLGAFFVRWSVDWLSRGGSFTQALRGVAYGIPLPICSCGVVPIYRSLVGRGVPATAGMAFLVATPELGIESVLLSWPLLGGTLAVVRLVCAILVALLVGWFVGRSVRLTPGAGMQAGDLSSQPQPDHLLGRLRRAVKIGLGDIVGETAPWILAGLAVAAALEPAELQRWLRHIPAGTDVVIFALAGLPLYICASGATPLAAVLLFKGVSPGAVVALLLTGPATNVTTFGVLSRLHGRRTAFTFAAAVTAVSVSLGYLVNGLLPAQEVLRPHASGVESAGWLAWFSLAILAAAFAVSLARMGLRGFLDVILSASEAPDPAERARSADRGHCHAGTPESAAGRPEPAARPPAVPGPGGWR